MYPRYGWGHGTHGFNGWARIIPLGFKINRICKHRKYGNCGLGCQRRNCCCRCGELFGRCCGIVGVVVVQLSPLLGALLALLWCRCWGVFGALLAALGGRFCWCFCWRRRDVACNVSTCNVSTCNVFTWQTVAPNKYFPRLSVKSVCSVSSVVPFRTAGAAAGSPLNFRG